MRAFDEWSKLLFAKMIDERSTKTGQPYRFQVGSKDTITAVANRIHALFAEARQRDATIFPDNERIKLNDKKIHDVVKVLQDISFAHTDADVIGAAFENFFGSVFRGELGQYFTQRQIARFAVAVLNVVETEFALDPTAGSGGFLLEILLQVWHRIDRDYAGQLQTHIDRIRNDFALHNVFGVEIHEVLARICKINLLLHHDGHTNIEGDRTCLDRAFLVKKLGAALDNPTADGFDVIVGNPPFGDDIEEGDPDRLGASSLSDFEIAGGRTKIASEQAIIERSIDWLKPGGRFGLVIPDGILNNQGELSNCPAVRRYLAKTGHLTAIISLPDYAFRKAGAQNKTSILFFRKYTASEQARFDAAYQAALSKGESEDDAIRIALRVMDYHVFLGEANFVGYTTTGQLSDRNDLYRGAAGGKLDSTQEVTILGAYQAFVANPAAYTGRTSPDCMAIHIADLWAAHPSHRLDPKYFLFKREERSVTPPGWVRLPIGRVMTRRAEVVNPEERPEDSVRVMTISQTGEIRPREAGKGRNPPQWLGMYFEDSPSTWMQARANDVIFSSIDLWKGCISVVPAEFDSALVTKEFPIYHVTDPRLSPEFLWCLLRSRYYQRAFRAITTGHSNRRRTQAADFEALEIVFPEDKGQQVALISDLLEARSDHRKAGDVVKEAMLKFSDLIDGRGDEELPTVEDPETDSDD
jgi:type I restriction enzyme M protein